MTDNKHKAGFVSIIGRPNVGKSTLINSLMKEKLSIITSKAQTTRHRIRGIINEDDYQIVLSDTPGILDPSYKLQEAMMKFIKETLIDSDFLVIVEEVGNKESFDEFGIKFDIYDRTSSQEHHETAQEIFQILNHTKICEQSYSLIISCRFKDIL